MTDKGSSRVLRWYPRAWRDRYGEEMSALIEDFAGEGKLRFWDHVDLIRVGLLLRRGTRPARPTMRRVQRGTIRLASAVVALLAAVMLIFSAYQSQTASSASSQVSVRNKTAIVVDVSSVAVTAGAAMTLRRGGQ